jgi:hypothetical protein
MWPVLKWLAAVCVAWAVVASLLVVGELQKRGVRVSFFWMRLLIPHYVAEYARRTREETGRTGPLLYHVAVPINAALVLVVIALLRAWR